MPAAKFPRFPGHNIGNLRNLDDTVCGLFLRGGAPVLGCIKPGYNLKLGKRARVLLPGQMTFEAFWLSHRFFDNFRKLFSFKF